MADNKLPKDEIEALRWFRQRLKALEKAHSVLKTPVKQERLSAYLTQQAIEELGKTESDEESHAQHTS